MKRIQADIDFLFALFCFRFVFLLNCVMVMACVLIYSPCIFLILQVLVCVWNCSWHDWLSFALVFHLFTCKLLLAIYRIESNLREIDFLVKHFASRFRCFSLVAHCHWTADTRSQNSCRVMKAEHNMLKTRSGERLRLCQPLCAVFHPVTELNVHPF